MNDTGSIFIHKNFAFKDGEIGKKLIIILGNLNNHIVAVKTTSQQYDRGLTYGCQPNDRFHNFYLPQGSCFFSKCTWVCLDEFYSFNDNELFLQRAEQNLFYSGDLSLEHLYKLQLCALDSFDITGDQESIIQRSLITLKNVG